MELDSHLQQAAGGVELFLLVGLRYHLQLTTPTHPRNVIEGTPHRIICLKEGQTLNDSFMIDCGSFMNSVHVR